MSIKVHVRFKGGHRNLLLYYVDPDTGREVSKSAETRDLRAADRAAAVWEAELVEYRGNNDDGWAYVRDRFEDEHLAALAPKTQKAFATALNHFERLMSIARVGDVSASTVSVFQSKLLAENRPVSTVCTYLTHLRTALNWAERIGVIRKAPRVKLPKQAKHTFMRGRPITEVEYRKMLKACSVVCGDDADAYRRLLELLWLSGLRLGEALALSWTRPPIVVDFDSGLYPQILYYAEGHKARRDDTVPMTPDLAAWLEKTPPKARRGLVAPVPLNSQSRISALIGEIGKAAGVVVNDDDKPATAHDFRRSFGTRWAQKVMPMTLQKLMRHADISTTLKYYVGLSASDAGRELWGAAGVPKSVPKQGRRGRRAG